MLIRRHLVLFACTTALTLALATGPAQAARDSGDLYLQEATSGKLSGSKLVLRGVDPRLTTFTDRPERRTGSLTTRSFVNGFSRTFRGDPPNAALQIDGGPARRDVALLELRRPRFDSRRRTLTYTVRRLPRTTGGLSRLGRRADRGVRGSFGRATLFIDSGGAGDFFSILLAAPQGQTTSLTLGGGASFDLEEQTTIIPLNPGTTPQLSIQGQTMSVTPNQSTGTVAVLIQTWIDVDPSPLTGTATIPSGGSASITVGGGTTTLSSGPFSVAF